MDQNCCQEEPYIIDDLAALKVLSDPFRMRILELMGKEPVTVKQIAADLAVSPKKLYYHVNLMEKHGLIRVIGTRLVSGIVEKQYQTRASSFVVDKSLLVLADAPGGEFSALGQLMDTIFGATREDVLQAARQRLIVADPDDRRRSSLHLQRCQLMLRPEERGAFVTRLEALIAEFDTDASSGAAEGGQPYGMTIALHPMAVKPPRALGVEER